ncbi:leucyl aminopeptidase [Allonocardiopsis opalescens]|uniref:leucyl aminopeptidase n=1 Tax=Allonocardiopsis opalescens TaxID=1144618 RepID=UPI000D057370|nr:leucyl aminopeptidase [Allonocardiopsis opalescens]
MSASLSITQDSPAAAEADALVVGVGQGADGPVPAPGTPGLGAALDASGGLAATLALLGASGRADEVHLLPTPGGPAPLTLAVGLGAPPADGAPYPAETLARAAGAAVRALAGKDKVVLALPAAGAAEVGAVALGALLGNYQFRRYRTGEQRRAPVGELLLATGAEGAEQAAHRAEVLAESVALTRDLVNTPPADLHPEDFAAIATEVAESASLSVEVLDEAALVEGGYGGLVGVGQGSVNPPRLVRLGYTHPEATATVAFVGKGITFDSGGLSLKPPAAMEWMKSDMAGAAAVLGALKAIARLGVAVNAVGYLALAENMPSGSAQRPSDVLTVYGGTTVEVLNTDAEGRLVLADALVRSLEDSPDLIVDIATLTGAQLVALGSRTSAVMANSDATRERVVAAAGGAGESMWPMPFPAELRKGLDSPVADIANVASDRSGGMLTAGIFLKEFVPDDVAWAHLDIAGPAFNQGEAYGYTAKGGTGIGVRTLVRVAEDLAGGADR